MKKAYLALVKGPDKKETTLTVGADRLSVAAKKAEAAVAENEEVVEVKLTKDVIL